MNPCKVYKCNCQELSHWDELLWCFEIKINYRATQQLLLAMQFMSEVFLANIYLREICVQ